MWKKKGKEAEIMGEEGLSDLGKNIEDGPTISKKKEAQGKKRKPVDPKKEYRKVRLNPIKFYLFNNKMRALYALTVCLVVAALIPLGVNTFWPVMRPVPVSPGLCVLQNTYRIECIPGEARTVTLDQCSARQCCWRDDETGGVFVPRCYHSFPAKYVYEVTSATQPNDRTRIYDLQTRDNSDKTPLGSKATRKVQATMEMNPAGKEGTTLFTLQPIQKSRRRSIFQKTLEASPPPVDLWESEFQAPGNYFFLELDRNSTGERIVDTSIGAMVISQGYTEVTFKLSTDKVIGFSGDESYKLAINFDYNSAVLFNRHEREDAMTLLSVPFYLAREKSGKFHGAYFDTGAPIEVRFSPTPAITVRILDDSLKWYFFEGPTPRDVLRQFAQITGNPSLPPYWAFGYHMCRDVTNITEFHRIHESMNETEMPYESDCVSSRLFREGTFAFNDQDFNLAEINDIRNTLMDEQRKMLVHHSPMIRAMATVDGVANMPYQDGVRLGVFLRNSTTGKSYEGIHNDATVVYPDFEASVTQEWINRLYTNLSNALGFDGVMLTQNTPIDESPYMKPEVEAGTLPYVPTLGDGRPMTYETIPWSVVSAEGAALTAELHGPRHNLYGGRHAASVVAALQGQQLEEKQERSFVTSESTDTFSTKLGGFTGGHYAADWVSLSKSVIHVLKAGILGQPFSGTPICGDLDPRELNASIPNAFEELCMRWHQLGLVLPLAFNHYSNGTMPRNPPDLGNDYEFYLRIALRQRYRLLPYFYSLAIEAVLENVPVVRPMFFEFPEDDNAFPLDAQFMIGSSLMAAPALQQGESTVNAYFPQGTWMDFYNGNILSSSEKGGKWGVFPVSGFQSPLALRGGRIVLWQNPGLTATASRLNPFKFSVAIERGKGAEGLLHFDDGATPVRDQATHPFGTVHVSLDRHETKLTFDLTDDRACNDPSIASRLNTVIDGGEVFNLGTRVTKVLVESTQEPVDFLYSPATKSVEFVNMTLLSQPMALCGAKPPISLVFLYTDPDPPRG